MKEIYQLIFVKGGPVMIPIVIGSVVALALFLERMWALRRTNVLPPAFRRRVRALARNGQLSEAEVLCQENASALAAIVGAALKHAGEKRAVVKESVIEVGRREVSHVERNIDLLGTIAAVEPLMGLLGTVTGLIRAFQKVEASATQGAGVNPGILAQGIWEALITTAAGLSVAIPAYLGYRYLQGRVDSFVVEMEEDSLEIADLIAEPSKKKKRAGSGRVASTNTDDDDDDSDAGRDE